jgi:hypothetical protein
MARPAFTCLESTKRNVRRIWTCPQFCDQQLTDNAQRMEERHGVVSKEVRAGVRVGGVLERPLYSVAEEEEFELR